MKKIIQKLLIIIGIILLMSLFIVEYMDTKSIINAFFTISLNTVLEFGKIESLLSILGILCIIIGIFSKENLNRNNSNKSLMKYKILKWIGIFPFIAILCIGLFSMINGFSFMFSTSYGISAFFESIMIISLFIWPLYIIGIALIIYSKKKITNIEKN